MFRFFRLLLNSKRTEEKNLQHFFFEKQPRSNEKGTKTRETKNKYVCWRLMAAYTQ